MANTHKELNIHNLFDSDDVPIKRDKEESKTWEKAKSVLSGLDPRKVELLYRLFKQAEESPPPSKGNGSNSSGNGGGRRSRVDFIAAIVLGLFLVGDWASRWASNPSEQRIIDKLDHMSEDNDKLQKAVLKNTVEIQTTGKVLMEYISATSEYNERPDSVNYFMQSQMMKETQREVLLQQQEQEEKEERERKANEEATTLND